MYKIYNNNYHKKLNITDNDLIKQTILNRIPNENKPKNLVSSNNIETNENIINTKKAYDAFKDSCSEFGYIGALGDNGGDMSLYYNRILSIMKNEGIDVPSFITDGTNNRNFLPFIDKMKDYAKD
ncbi:hypothetical protein, partial [Clostridium botulinum]